MNNLLFKIVSINKYMLVLDQESKEEKKSGENKWKIV